MTFTPAMIASLAPMTLTGPSGGSQTLATEMVGVSFGIIQQIHHHSGNVMPTLVVIPGADRRIRVSMPFLEAINTFGLQLTQLSALSTWLAVFEDFNRDSSSVHPQLSLSSNCVAGAQISGWTVSADGILMATVDIIFLSSDGATDPVTLTQDTALPSISGSPLLHTLGPILYDSAIIPGGIVSGGSVGSTPTILRTDGDFFARSAARLMASPVISITHSDPTTLINALTTLGGSISGNVISYFKSFDNTTGVSENTGGISLTMAAGRIVPHGTDANQGAVATTGVDIIGISSDGEANTIAVATNVTVPTPP